jgi:hypothetical protein
MAHNRLFIPSASRFAPAGATFSPHAKARLLQDNFCFEFSPHAQQFLPHTKFADKFSFSYADNMREYIDSQQQQQTKERKRKEKEANTTMY